MSDDINPQEDCNQLIDSGEYESSESKGALSALSALGGCLVMVIILLAVVGFLYQFVVKVSKEEDSQQFKISLVNKSVNEPVDARAIKEMIEDNLRAFLSAESVEQRARFIYHGESELPSLRIYYEDRGRLETPLWKVERCESIVAGYSEIWFVVFRDVKGRQHTASFQQFGDDYLLHWSAMKAFGEITWERFMVDRPMEPVTMRGYLRRYEGVQPLWAGSGQGQCYIIEDRDGIFSEIAFMASSAHGFEVLRKLPSASRHPVTLMLAYQASLSSGKRKVLTINSLVNLRWQKLSADPQLQKWDEVELKE